MSRYPDPDRRRFLKTVGAVGATVVGAGCSESEESETESATDSATDTEATPEDSTQTEADTATEEDEDEETDVSEDSDYPTDTRWDLAPGRNDNLRNELGQYVDSVGSVRQDHPAFEYSTDQESDDVTVDFEALRMIRDSNFDIFVNEKPNTPLGQIVESFVDDSIYTSTKNDIYRSHVESPETFTADSWLNADTVEESLDLGHNYLITLRGEEQMSVKEMAVSIREAYQRHHDFDVLAWEVPMNDGALSQGMMYSPDDDKIRSFAGLGEWNGNGESQFHTEIQDWRVVSNQGSDAYELQHPIMFHTDEWDRQGVTFEEAKEDAVGMIFDIATDDYNSYNVNASSLNDAIIDNITLTTGAAEQLTRTMLDYNNPNVDADFSDIRDLASLAVGKYIENPEINGVIDTVGPNDDYDEYFDGGFAFYGVEDEEIVDEVRNDQSHDYDNFGEVYDELDTPA